MFDVKVDLIHSMCELSKTNDVVAYCLTCKTELAKHFDSSFIEDEVNVHKEEYPDHEIIIGFVR